MFYVMVTYHNYDDIDSDVVVGPFRSSARAHAARDRILREVNAPPHDDPERHPDAQITAYVQRFLTSTQAIAEGVAFYESMTEEDEEEAEL